MLHNGAPMIAEPDWNGIDPLALTGAMKYKP